MTKQQIFDKVAKHLLRQGERAKDINGCRYKTASGLKCAVGCLIPARHYTPAIEGESIQGLSDELLEKCGLSPVRHVALLKTLQGVHDGCDPQHWRTHLKDVAKEFKLSTKALQ